MGGLSLDPAPGFDAVLDFAGGRPFARRAALWTRRRSETLMVRQDGKPLALAFLYPLSAKGRRLELALMLKPDTRRHMPALVRLARLTLSRIAQDGRLVKARVRASDTRARRMARLAGFTPGGFADPDIWLWRRT